MVSKKRHLAKAVSYRIASSGFTFLLVFIMTGQLAVGITVSFAEAFFKLFFYYIHERIWYRFSDFGVKKD